MFLCLNLLPLLLQKFFVNEAHWQRPDGPVFLFIGGEGPIFSFDVLAGSQHLQVKTSETCWAFLILWTKFTNQDMFFFYYLKRRLSLGTTEVKVTGVHLNAAHN